MGHSCPEYKLRFSIQGSLNSDNTRQFCFRTCPFVLSAPSTSWPLQEYLPWGTCQQLWLQSLLAFRYSSSQPKGSVTATVMICLGMTFLFCTGIIWFSLPTVESLFLLWPDALMWSPDAQCYWSVLPSLVLQAMCAEALTMEPCEASVCFCAMLFSLTQRATKEDIKRVYKKFSLQYHPVGCKEWLTAACCLQQFVP